MKEKQKKLKEMRYHQVQSTPFVQPTVDQTLLAAAIAQGQAMGGAAVNPVFVNPVGGFRRIESESPSQST